MPNRLLIIKLHKTEFENGKQLVQLFRERGYSISQFSFFKKQNKTFQSKLELIFREFLCFLKLHFLLFSLGKGKVLCFAGHISLFLFCKIWGRFFRKDFHIYVYNFYLHAMGEKRTVKKILKFLLNSSRITLIVQSPSEVNYYTSLSKKCNILFVPFCDDIKNETNIVYVPPKFKRYIFAGGYTNRDYSLMIKCAESLPEIQFVFIPSSLNMQSFPNNIPTNVTLYKDVKSDFFYEVMRNALAVVIPLKDNVGASGQMSVLNAMALSKPIIYSNLSAVNYYFENVNCGIPYEKGNLQSLIDAINKLTNYTEEEIKSMGNKAYNNYKSHYTLIKRDEALREIINN